MTSYDVFARYVIRQPLGWAFDMSYYLYATVFMMGGAYAMSRNQHVRGDIFYRTWPVKVQAAVELFLLIIAFFPGMIAFVSSGLQYAIPAMQIGERTQTSFVQLPLWPLKMVIPLAGVFMVLAGVVETIRAITALRTGTWPQRLADVEEVEQSLLAAQEQL